MSTEVIRRHGTTLQHASFTGAASEITIDTDKNTAVVHDGVTAGGHPLSKASDLAAHEADTSTHGVTGAVVGTTDTQTLSGKDVSVDTNTISGIAASSFVLSDASGNIDGAAAQKAIPTGVVVGTTDSQTLSGKGISLTTNTVTGTAAEFDAACTDDNFFFQSDVVRSILAQSSVSVGIAPSGTMGNNGALTLGTALNLTYDGGIWLYFPAGAIETGSAAGFYWTVMSTTTAGTVYNNTRVSTDLPVVVSSPTAFVTTGPGAFTGVTSVIVFYEKTVVGGSMGPNGRITTEMMANWSNSAGTKSIIERLGASTFRQIISTTTSAIVNRKSIRNCGTEARQITQVINLNDPNYVAHSAASVFSTEDTTTDKTISFRAQMVTSATDFVIIDAFNIDLTYGA